MPVASGIGRLAPATRCRGLRKTTTGRGFDLRIASRHWRRVVGATRVGFSAFVTKQKAVHRVHSRGPSVDRRRVLQVG